jgi:hypothetical protein
MSTLVVSTPTMTAATTPPTQALTAADVFPAPGERYLLVVSGATSGSITVTVDDPTSQSPLGATAFNPDLVLPAVPVTPAKRVFLLSGCSRFRDANGNINLATSGTPAGSNIEIYAV